MVTDALQGIAGEGRNASKHFVENDPEGEKIGTRALSTAMNLFGAPVSGSAEQRGIGALVVGEARHAEIRELYAVFERDEDIGGLDVAVNDRAAVGDVESHGDMSGPVASLGKRDAAFGENLFEGLPFNELHDKVRSGSRFLDTHVVQGNDGSMGELADDTRLTKKAVPSLATGEFRREKFNGHGAVDERIVAADDTAVSACADGFQDLVATDLHG